jgi:(p)ppGpp synthase/HD superfamily hydrolase
MSLEAAICLAEKLHADQVDKAGQPYVQHLMRVGRHLETMFPEWTEAEMEAAWLHDALEDTDATADTLLAAGVTAEAVAIVQWLTKRSEMPGASYLNWIRSFAEDGPVGAIRVKLADNRDNSDPDRVAALPGAEAIVRTRYAPAREILKAALFLREAVAHK